MTVRKCGVEFGMINDDTDSILQSLLEAVATGAGIALRLKDYSSGKGPDADYTLAASWGMP